MRNDIKVFKGRNFYFRSKFWLENILVIAILIKVSIPFLKNIIYQSYDRKKC